MAGQEVFNTLALPAASPLDGTEVAEIIQGRMVKITSVQSFLGPDVTRIVKITQSAYNALSPPDDKTLYLITS